MENKTSKKRGRGLKFVAFVVIAALAAGGGYYLWSAREAEIQYKTVPVVRSDLRSTIQATGTLNPVETVDVGTQISGTIQQLFFDYNSVVKEGQLIALMDSATQEAEVAQARATLASAQADVLNAQAALDVAEKDLARTKALAERDLIAMADVDADTSVWLQAKANLASCEAKVLQYKAALDKTLTNLGYTKIYSPVDGVVVSKSVEEGQTVAASYQTPSIAEIARDLTQMQVEVNVDEADIGGVHDGQSAVFTVDAYPTINFDGEVTQVRLSPTEEDNVVTYTVIVKVQNPEGKLLPGMTANVSLILEDRENVLVVPNSAFRFKPAEAGSQVDMGPPGPGGPKQNIAAVTAPAVYTLDKKKPVKIEVEKGITDGEHTEIVSGIEEGAFVITGIIVPKEGN